MPQDETVRVFKVSASGISAAGLRFRDLLDIAKVTGLDVMDLSPILEGKKGSGTDRLMALAAFTWIIERRYDPDLTFDAILDGRVEVVKDTEKVNENPTLFNPETPF